ncbi:MAG TPA: hypothetical protein VFX84_02670 [Candidatus Saccharimonadales bacterium]|nr:hypothetical protein [Candidatus Saccharimonadales bacterium]
MPRKRSWTDEELKVAVQSSRSYRMVLIKLRLIPAGGNYQQIHKRIKELALSTEHFCGQRWNTGLTYRSKLRSPLADLLKENSNAQSYKLKKRLYEEGIKKA